MSISSSASEGLGAGPSCEGFVYIEQSTQTLHVKSLCLHLLLIMQHTHFASALRHCQADAVISGSERGVHLSALQVLIRNCHRGPRNMLNVTSIAYNFLCLDIRC